MILYLEAWNCLLTIDEFFEEAGYDKEVQFYALSIRAMSVRERINLQPEEGSTYIIRVK